LKVRIEGTQEELEEKRFTLVKAMAGKQYDVSLSPVYKPPFYVAQKEMMDYWNDKYDEMLQNIMKEIDEVI
jgi:hypothetical protein